MQKPFKTFIIILLTIVLGLAVFIVPVVGILGIRVYLGRYRECNPKELLPMLERVYDVNFPADIVQLRTAKTPNHDKAIFFIVKLTTEPSVVNRFLGNIVEMDDFEPYERGHTFTTYGWPSPSWARQPIKQGKKYTTSSVRGVRTRAYIYIDTTHKDNYVVYMQGIYNSSFER
jgi:hypothetical protein